MSDSVTNTSANAPAGAPANASAGAFASAPASAPTNTSANAPANKSANTSANAPDGASTSAPTCPGCHFGCLIDAYQCARGKDFYEKWLAGEEVPERRAPWKTASAGSKADGRKRADAQGGSGKRKPGEFALTADMKLMHMLGIVGIALSEHRETSAERCALDAIARQNGCATERIVAGRARLDGDALAPALEKLRQAGLVADIDDEVAGPMLQVTEKGAAQSETWRKERMAADSAFVDALNEGEKERLTELIVKMLTSSAHAGKMP